MNKIPENQKREDEIVGVNILNFEDELTAKRVISRLSFIKEDLKAINKMNIKSDEINKEIKEIYEKINLLFDLFLNKSKQNDFVR